MQMTAKHEKVLAMAGASYGAPVEIYQREANELRAAGLIVTREVFSKAGGNRKLRWFLKPTADDFMSVSINDLAKTSVPWGLNRSPVCVA